MQDLEFFLAISAIPLEKGWQQISGLTSVKRLIAENLQILHTDFHIVTFIWDDTGERPFVQY